MSQQSWWHSQRIGKEQRDGWPLGQTQHSNRNADPQQKPPSSKSTRGVFHHLGEPTFLLIGQKNKQANNELEKMYRWQKFPEVAKYKPVGRKGRLWQSRSSTFYLGQMVRQRTEPTQHWEVTAKYLKECPCVIWETDRKTAVRIHFLSVKLTKIIKLSQAGHGRIYLQF